MMSKSLKSGILFKKSLMPLSTDNLLEIILLSACVLIIDLAIIYSLHYLGSSFKHNNLILFFSNVPSHIFGKFIVQCGIWRVFLWQTAQNFVAFGVF